MVETSLEIDFHSDKDQQTRRGTSEEDSTIKLNSEEQVVYFRTLESPEEDLFGMKLSGLLTHDDVVERVSRQLGLDDPSTIRLTSHNNKSQGPKPQPLRNRGVVHLSDMVFHGDERTNILYYEVLEKPKVQGLKMLKVAFHHAKKDEVTVHTIELPKNSTVGDVLNDLKPKVGLSHEAKLRLFEVYNHETFQIFQSSEKIENVNDQNVMLRAEEIPEEEQLLAPEEKLIHVFHFTKETAQTQMEQQIQNFGEPFFLVIREGENLGGVKERIQKKLHVPDEDFSKWKFALMSLGCPDYLQDTEVVFTRFQRKDVYGAWEHLGLEHART